MAVFSKAMISDVDYKLFCVLRFGVRALFHGLVLGILGILFIP